MPFYRVTIHATVLEEEVYEIEADSADELRETFVDAINNGEGGDPVEPLSYIEVTHREITEIKELLGPVYQCGNCSHQETDPPLAPDLYERLDDGGVATTRECSECGALTYPKEVE
jgi:hypothetical protein